MLDAKTFQPSDRRWLEKMLRAYLAAGTLTMAQRVVVDVLLGVAGVEAKSTSVFPHRPPAGEAPPAKLKKPVKARKAKP